MLTGRAGRQFFSGHCRIVKININRFLCSIQIVYSILIVSLFQSVRKAFT